MQNSQQNAQQNSQQKSFAVGPVSLTYGLFALKIRNGFRTAHCFTTQRNNFTVRVSYAGLQGCGQAGLPPKKPGCYLADLEDCFNAMAELQLLLATAQNEPFTFEFPAEYFAALKEDSKHAPSLLPILAAAHALRKPEQRACKSAVEFAIMDIWSKALGLSLAECIYGRQVESRFRSFFTVSFNEDAQKMVEEAEGGLKYSPYIKIKMDNDQTLNKSILQAFKAANVGKLWVIDANASWSVDTAMQVATVILAQNLQQRVLYIEQPFPLDFYEVDWESVRLCYNKLGIRIMADESFSTCEDVAKIDRVADAVNIKIEKTGGLIEALRAVAVARDHKKTVWIGSMISSHLGCTQAYQLHQFAEYGDLDGGWLTISPYTSGFTVKEQGLLVNNNSPGLGCFPQA